MHVPKPVAYLLGGAVVLGAIGAPALADSLIGSTLTGTGSTAGSVVHHQGDLKDSFDAASSGAYDSDGPAAPTTPPKLP